MLTRTSVMVKSRNKFLNSCGSRVWSEKMFISFSFHWMTFYPARRSCLPVDQMIISKFCKRTYKLLDNYSRHLPSKWSVSNIVKRILGIKGGCRIICLIILCVIHRGIALSAANIAGVQQAVADRSIHLDEETGFTQMNLWIPSSPGPWKACWRMCDSV
jgi:hypothetical protein